MALLKFLLLVASCFTTTSCTAIVAERGLPDGIYEVVPQEHHDESPSTVPSHGSLRRRGGSGDLYEKPSWMNWDDYSVPIPASRVLCYKKHGVLNSTDYRRAVENLWSYCQHFNMASHGAHFSVAGEVVVYVCAYGKEGRCHRHEWYEAEKLMEKGCGAGRDGHVEMSKWMKEYGRSHVGATICNSYNLGSDLAWKVQMLPVWVNEQMYGHWKAGEPKYKPVEGANKGKTG
ncbi:hypothetical protein ACHAQJ_006305 [Trichoderma viride]